MTAPDKTGATGAVREIIAEVRRRHPQAFDGSDPLTDLPHNIKNWAEWVLSVKLADALAAPEAGGEGELVAELERVTDHLETWARDHGEEATSETYAALHCARAAIAKSRSSASPGVRGRDETDARRYRYLRDRDAGPAEHTPPGLFIGRVPENLILTGEDADGAIDAAIGTTSGETDRPEADATDFAHPAWWRGEAYGFDEMRRAVEAILDGKDQGHGTAREPWETVRRRLLALIAPREAVARLQAVALGGHPSEVYNGDDHGPAFRADLRAVLSALPGEAPGGSGAGGMVVQLDDDLTKLLDGVVGVVEANTFEQHALWEQNERYGHRKWVQNLSGRGVTVGHVGDMPVFISLITAEVSGCKLLFVNATSQVVDHRMVDEWLTAALPKSAFRDGGERINRVDAANFCNVFAAPAEQNHPTLEGRA
jgi:hypothetical protein